MRIGEPRLPRNAQRPARRVLSYHVFGYSDLVCVQGGPDPVTKGKLFIKGVPVKCSPSVNKFPLSARPTETPNKAGEMGFLRVNCVLCSERRRDPPFSAGPCLAGTNAMWHSEATSRRRLPRGPSRGMGRRSEKNAILVNTSFSTSKFL